jgi:hypothetical protein
LDSQSCFHTASIYPGVDSRSRGCLAPLAETHQQSFRPFPLSMRSQVAFGVHVYYLDE